MVRPRKKAETEQKVTRVYLSFLFSLQVYILGTFILKGLRLISIFDCMQQSFLKSKYLKNRFL